MKLIILIFILCFQITAQAQCDYKVANGIVGKFVNYQGPSTDIIVENEVNPLSFIFKDKDGCYGKYITLDLEFSEVKNVFQQVNSKVGNLKNRGEAHITLLTPPEFQYFFASQGITISDLKKVIIQSYSAQNIRYEITGLGSGHLDNLSTYFLIVESQDLKAIREKLGELLPSDMRAKFLKTGFYPHITLGFNKRDLHISQGIRKDLEFSNDRRFRLLY